MSKIAKGLLYSESHEWVKVEGNIAVIGVSDFAQAEMGDITYVDLPDEGDEIEKGEDFGALESVKASSELYAPVSGKVVEVNTALEDASAINNDPYGAGWIIKIKPENMADINALLDAAAYTAKIGA